jgi:hypothetical protein
MNPDLYGVLIAGIVGGAAIAGSTAASISAPRQWPSVVGLGGLIVALLAVGVVSGTLIRHLIQVAPPALALILVAGGSSHGRSAALPILTFWAALMAVIWTFLLGLTRIIGGRFTAGEIGLTIAIAAVCLAGLAGGARPTANLSRPRRIATALAFGLLQLAALWVSLQPLANL